MGLIYKPNALYMTPRNESVDISMSAIASTGGVPFSFVFKGYQMSKAIGRLYQNSNVGEWIECDSFPFAQMTTSPFYNNQTISSAVGPPTSAYSLMVQNVNSTLGWGVTVYGMLSTQTASSDNKMTPALQGFETGDMVAVYEGSDDSTPYSYTYIDSYTSKVQLGLLNVTDGSYAITKAEYINLTTGDEIKQNVSSTSYYIRKEDEGESDLESFRVTVYTSKLAAMAGGTSGLVTSGVARKSFYVNPTTTSSSTFYVGLIGGNVIKLYTTKEAALQAVEEAVVTLTEGSTYTIQIYENSQIVQFTPILANSIVFDEDDIYPENRTFTLTQLTGTDIYIYSDNQVDLYSGQQIRIDYGTYQKVYYIKILNADDSQLRLYVGNSDTPAVLDTGNTATAELIECLDDSVMFVVKWSDNNNIPLVSRWEAMLYGYEDGASLKLIEKSEMKYNADVRYQFSHLLLSSLSGSGSGKYKVAFNVWDNNDYEYYGEIIFNVGYPVSEINYAPELIVDNCESSVVVDWNNAVSATGVTDIADLDYVSNFYTDGNNGVTIPAGKTITFETSIPAGGFPTFLWQPKSNFTGTIFSMDGDSQSASLNYDNVSHIFVFNVTDKNSQSTISINVDTDVSVLNTSHVYLIGYADNKVYVRDLNA